MGFGGVEYQSKKKHRVFFYYEVCNYFYELMYISINFLSFLGFLSFSFDYYLAVLEVKRKRTSNGKGQPRFQVKLS